MLLQCLFHGLYNHSASPPLFKYELLNRVKITLIFQQEWMKVLGDYVGPIQRLVFEGYSFKGNALLSFVVKYHEEGQRKLRPHHDHSTFTTNTALNRQGIDYQVGFRLQFVTFILSLSRLNCEWFCSG